MGWEEPKFESLTKHVETLQEIHKRIDEENVKILENLISVLESKKEIDDELEKRPDSSTSPE